MRLFAKRLSRLPSPDRSRCGRENRIEDRNPRFQAECDDLPYRFLLVVAHCRRSGFDFVNAEKVEQTGDTEFFLPSENHSGSLFAIAQSAVNQPSIHAIRYSSTR
jgi:hypothetical protein